MSNPRNARQLHTPRAAFSAAIIRDLEEYSATLFGDEVYVPPIDNYDSIEQQYSATELPQVMLGVNSLGTEIDIKSLLETTEDRSSQLIWE
ncbi:hypothetical protein FXO38_26324 [Capsicum annuum]|nr:hypothetical protein FXO37_28963 [Capsicum annuum]KAF3632055.1 hypothetical protein FXO38_26324 [Capsicum annuum]